MRITIVCSETLVLDANHLAMALAVSEADASTFLAPRWSDRDGRLYSVASWENKADWVQGSRAELVHPAWDTGEIIYLGAAARAQGALDYWTPSEETPAIPEPSPGTVQVIVGIDGPAAVAAMGLRRATGAA